MHLFPYFKHLFLAACLSLLTIPVIAAGKQINTDETNKTISQIYHSLNNKPLTMSARIDAISAQFLGQPYLLGALGEGTQGDYDQWPLYRTDAFDCETYVDTVLALALANNPHEFKQCVNKVRYNNGQVDFVKRNHFTCLDWNKNNQRQGFVKDITTMILDQNKKSVVKFARAFIDKPSWYSHMTLNAIRLNSGDETERLKRLESLRQAGAHLPKATSIIPYLPLTALFDQTGKANQYLFKQIPNAAIIEIIRPNWDLSQEIGTHLNVSHLGFAIWKKNTLYFREASSSYGKVVDVSLIDYLRDTLKSPTIKGINVQVVLPQKNIIQ
jgi:hypothetical protein